MSRYTSFSRANQPPNCDFIQVTKCDAADSLSEMRSSAPVRQRKSCVSASLAQPEFWVSKSFRA